MSKVGIILLNYNLPKETDLLTERIKQVVKCPYVLAVVDNASDKAIMAKSTTIRTYVNMKTGGANIIGTHALADKHPGVDTYFFMHNDMWFDNNTCPLTPLLAIMNENPGVVVVHPAIREDVRLEDSFLEKNHSQGWKYAPRNSHGKIIMDDISPVLVKKEAYWEVGGFDPRLSRSFGAGLNLYDRLASRGHDIAICYDVEVYRKGQYNYRQGIAKEANATSDQEALKERDFVFTEKYGSNWKTLFDREEPKTEKSAFKKIFNKLASAFNR